MKVMQLVRARGKALLLARATQPQQQQQTRSALSTLAMAQRSQTRAALLRRDSELAVSMMSSSMSRRQFAAATAVRLSAAPIATPSASGSAAPGAPESMVSGPKAAADAAPAEDVDSVKIDLSTIGAETTRVLTIADVLSSREQQVASRSAELFEEWESIPGSQSVHDAVELMVKCNMRSLIVTEESAGIVGIITERDVLRKTSPRTILTQETLVRDIMSSHIMCVPPTTTVIDALATMTKENIRHLAVINGELSNTVKIGSVPEEAMRCVLSIKDIVKAYAEFEAEKKQLLLQQHAQAQSDNVAATGSNNSASSDTKAAANVVASSAVDNVASATSAAATTSDATAAATSGAVAEPAATATDAAATDKSAVTAATLLKKKHKKIKLILNTREEDNISVADAVEAMARQNFGAVLIVDKDQRVLGIFTERDYLAKVVYYKEDPSAIRMVDVSTRNVACLQIEDSLEKCWSQAATQDFRHFPVIGVMRKDREKELAGILSIKDIVREISKEHNTTPGFRLMEFFKSKMEPAAVPQVPVAPAPATTPAPETTTTVTTSSSTNTTATPEASTTSKQ